MVSLWPWKGNDDSPASFEKALSSLASKISKTQLQLDTLRQRSRRLKALWTLYTSIAYMLCAIVLGLVVGVKNLGMWEYTGMASSPVIIYLVRTAITSYYAYRIGNVNSRLEEQQTERTKTIEKLKAATKYNSTQQLLEKYGAAPSSPKPKASASTTKQTSKKGDSAAVQPQRTGIGPPPTANIARPSSQATRPNQPGTPIQIKPTHLSRSGTPREHGVHAQADFAPNAYPAVPTKLIRADSSYSGHTSGGKWYDRLLDVLLGDDETSPKNRVVLICQNCRLVNGQAPPGIKNLVDVGRWRCAQCGAWNGEADEATKLVDQMKEQMNEAGAEISQKHVSSSESAEKEIVGSVAMEQPEGADENDGSEEEAEVVEEEVENKPKATRGRPKKSK